MLFFKAPAHHFATQKNPILQLEPPSRYRTIRLGAEFSKWSLPLFQRTLSLDVCHQVTCVINNFQQLLPGIPPPRPQRPESMLGMPMVTLPSVESPLEKLSGHQVRGGGGCEAQLCTQKG